MRIRDRRAAEELDALLDGRVPAEEAGRDARRLARLASVVADEQPGPVATLAEDRRLLLRDRLLDDIAALEADPAPQAAPAAGARRPARTAVASVLASAMIGGTGVAVAAQESLPGDMLYGLKQGTESVRMNLAHDATQSGRLELRFAEERLEEITAGADRLSVEALSGALDEMDRRSLAGAQQLVLSAEQEGDEQLLAELDAFVERQSVGLVEAFGRLPVQARPHAEDSLAVLRQIRSDLLDPALEACDCLDVVPAGHRSQREPAPVTSDPLPAEPREEEPAREDDSGGGSEAGDSESTSGGIRQPVDDATSGDLPTSDGSGDGDAEVREPLRDAGREVGEKVGETVDKTLDGTGKVVEDTLEGTGDAVDETTDSVGDLLEGTGDAVEDTVDGAGDAVDETTDSVTEGVDDLLGSTTSTLGRLLGR